MKAYYFKSGAASKAVCGASDAAPRGGASDGAQDIGRATQPAGVEHDRPVCHNDGREFEPAADPPVAECLPSGLAIDDCPGYLVLRTGPRAQRGPGYFRCDWEVLEAVLGVPEGQLAGALNYWNVDVKKCCLAEAERRWQRRGQKGDLPVYF